MSASHDSEPAIATRSKRRGRIFALTLAGGFLFLAVLAYWRGGQLIAAVGVSLSAISFLAAVFIPGRLEPIERAWTKLGAAIGYITTPVLMAAVYYLILTPIAVARRVTRRGQPLEDSQWHRRGPSPPPARMERQF
jgi:multisubunit Na+/H+ antiporter MnhE subunit